METTPLEYTRNTIEFDEANEKDIPSLLQLQQRNLEENVPPAKRVQRGFLTLQTDHKLLNTIITHGITEVARGRGEVVGYVMTFDETIARTIPLFISLCDCIYQTNYQTRSLSEYTWGILAQACVDEHYSGKGILRKLYERIIPPLQDRFDVMIGEIRKENKQSLTAHQKLGLKIIDQYSFEEKEWCVVLLDLRTNLNVKMKI